MIKNFTVKAQLIFGFVLLSALLVAIGAMGLFGISRSNADLYSVYADRLVPLEQLTHIDRLILRNRLLIANSLLMPEPDNIRKSLDELEANVDEISKVWEAYMTSYLTPEEKELAEKFATARNTFLQEGVKATAALLRDDKLEEAHKLGEAYKLFVGKIRSLYQPVKEAVDALIKLQIYTARQEYERAQANYETIRNLAIAMVVLGVGLASLGGYLLVRAVTGAINQAVGVAEAIAGGDLTHSVTVDRNDEFGKLLRALKDMCEKLVEVVGNVRNGSASIVSASKQIAEGNANLSQRTQEQASALEETASSMEEMTSTVKQNADNAHQARQLVTSAREKATAGGEVVTKAVAAMEAINSSSKKIADIIAVIDEIAFQTNLLALNAAVEAARAGEQGRGFAVVAAEVRNLAQRSASAAKEIKDLINDSVDKVRTGSELVDASGKALAEIVESVKKVTDIVAEIAAASQEQASGIEQVNKAVMQMDEMTQQNAALVEEAAAASKAMEEQAHALNELVAFFKLDETGPVPSGTVDKGHASHARGNGASELTLQPHVVHASLKPAAASRTTAAPVLMAKKAAGNGEGIWEEF